MRGFGHIQRPGGAWQFDGASFRDITEYVGELKESQGSFFSPLSQNAHFVVKHSLVTYTDSGGVYYLTFPNVEMYSYNLISGGWGTGVFVGTTGAASNRSKNYVPLTGDPAALRALVSPSDTLPDLMWLIDTAEAAQVLKNNAHWGQGTLTTTVGAGILAGHVEGIGGNDETLFSRLTPELGQSYSFATSPPTRAGNTELLLYAYTADAVDAMSPGTVRLSDVASSTAQKRFDFNIAAPYARFLVYFPIASGHEEVLDYQLPMKSAGKL